MKIVIETDLEGVSGVVSFEDQAYSSGKYYESAKRMLTAEVNAAVEGLVEEGVTDVLVVDGHGPGGMCFEDLKPPAKLLHGHPQPPPRQLAEVYRRYDAAILIGQHGMAGVRQATLNHTQSSRAIESYALNGKLIGETAQCALFDGALGLPLIFLSGDVAACAEARDLLPAIVTAAVKEGLTRQCAISLAREEAHRLIREGVRLAIRRHRESPMAPLVWKGPFVLEKRFLFTDGADAQEWGPGWKRTDARTLSRSSADILDVIYA